VLLVTRLHHAAHVQNVRTWQSMIHDGISTSAALTVSFYTAGTH